MDRLIGWDNRGVPNFWYDGAFTSKAQDPKRWAAFIQKERDQLTELLTWYGPIDTLCLDMRWCKEAQDDAYKLAKRWRQLQPNILLRNRGIDDYGDYETPERTIPEDPSLVNRPWQVIYPCGGGFSYHKQGPFKSREWILESLIDIVAKGGNFQAGFVPGPDGKWQQEVVDRLSYVGDWLKVNGEAIYGTRPYLRYHEGDDLRFTRSKDKRFVYLISLKWPGASLTSALLKAKAGTAIRMIGCDEDLAWRIEGGRLIIAMPKAMQDEARRPCKQAYAFKVESDDWRNFAASLPSLPSLPGAENRSAMRLPAGALGIHFQPAGATVRDGFLADSGQVFADRGNGRRYGWSRDHTSLARARAAGGVTSTFCHFHQGASWSIELPNGVYRVTVGVGDAAYESDNTINVEGVNFCAGLKMNAQTRELTRELDVKNGKLAIDSGDAGDKKTKITHVVIVRIR